MMNLTSEIDYDSDSEIQNTSKSLELENMS